MAIDIKKLKISNKPFANIKTSIGDLYLFEVRIKELIKIEENLGSKLEEIESEEFFRLYLPFFAYLKQDLIGNELERPDEYKLKSEDIDKLTKEELEEIAILFIEKHSSLYKDLTSSSSKKEDGTPVISLKEEINESLLKYPNESYIDYVYRLVLERHKKEQEHAKKILATFSSGLSNDILKTIGLGESIKNSLDSFKSIINKTKPISSSLDDRLESIVHDHQMRTVSPFKDLSSKMDLMIDAEKQTVSFMDNVYKTQVEIASELKSSSDSANENSKLNIRYTRLIIGLTVFTAFITSISVAYPVWFDNSSSELIKTNESIKTSIVETNLKLEKLTEVLIKQTINQNNQINILNEEIKNIQLNVMKKDSVKVLDNNISN